MSNLRNQQLRTRDIKKLVTYKFQSIIWDKGCDSTSEWVLTSIENEEYKDRIIIWLQSKNISSSCECVLVKNNWTELKRLEWCAVLENPKHYFCNESFHLYDVDLSWVLEYEPQEISRFGKIGKIP